MPNYILLPMSAMEESGFKTCQARKQTLGTAESLEQAQRMALDHDGASIFLMQKPAGMPDIPGGHQPFGEPITDLKDLQWLCFIQVLIPGTLGTEMIRQQLDEVEEIEEAVKCEP